MLAEVGVLIVPLGKHLNEPLPFVHITPIKLGTIVESAGAFFYVHAYTESRVHFM